MSHILKKLLPLFFIALFLPTLAMAQTVTSLAVVDMQKLLTASDAAKDIQKQMDGYKETFLSDISKQEQALRTEEKDLSAQQAKTDKDEFAKKVKTFEQKLMTTRKDAQAKKKALDEGLAKAVGQLRDQTVKIVQDIANEKKYNLVISRQNVVIGANALDITDETMTRLNKAVSKIKVEVAK